MFMFRYDPFPEGPYCDGYETSSGSCAEDTIEWHATWLHAAHSNGLSLFGKKPFHFTMNEVGLS